MVIHCLRSCSVLYLFCFVVIYSFFFINYISRFLPNYILHCLSLCLAVMSVSLICLYLFEQLQTLNKTPISLHITINPFAPPPSPFPPPAHLFTQAMLCAHSSQQWVSNTFITILLLLFTKLYYYSIFVKFNVIFFLHSYQVRVPGLYRSSFS